MGPLLCIACWIILIMSVYEDMQENKNDFPKLKNYIEEYKKSKERMAS